jgi:rRNA processing protein Gar1
LHSKHAFVHWRFAAFFGWSSRWAVRLNNRITVRPEQQVGVKQVLGGLRHPYWLMKVA